MAYYFMIEKKKGEYFPLNISSSKYFSAPRKYNKSCAYTLQEIDIFTMMFNDEQELRNALLLEGILPPQLVAKPLSIRTLNKEKYTKVPHDFLYQKDIEYIMEPTRLVELIMKRYYQNDFLFIKKFADNFSNFYECRTTAPEVRQLTEQSIREGRRNLHLDEIDKNGDKLVVRLVKLLILEHYEQTDGYIHYKDKVNYRNLHAVIAFINNYDNKTNQKQESSQITLESSTKYTPQNSIIIKSKQKNRKKYDLEGQISFKI